MLPFLFVALGGAAGATLRFAISRFLNAATLLPAWVATLCINVLGSFCIALFIALCQRYPSGLSHLNPLLITGFCGGFTTFSTFTNEAYSLWVRGEIPMALLYVAISLLLSLGGLLVGYYVGEKI